ncbi:FAD-linked oxidase [Leptolyngbya sp. 'hensonii']|uniref:FAD-binding oxidoreductase n=1 Tax=Leptolyngbya sp. 'hensonii' TaxID=1922337 RepID=UPI00094FBDCB|nr:FAD-binding oxidoreductase [Leptolyngbya sp. 'hensonii']OLP17599.1 FAD-linked oxidase [Leptolyngbya sp. 'hensonii']
MTLTPARSTSLDVLLSDLAGLDVITDLAQVMKLSVDYYHFSPVLQKQLEGKTGDLVVRPVSEAEVLRVAEVCVRHQVPLTVRGAGTGNYGQCVPLEGGIILDMTRMQAILRLEPGLACVEPGVKLAALDKQAREIGWEIRMAPSTYKTATIGGFIAGGSGGIGSITYGQLRDRGNLLAVRVVTLEDQPRVLVLRGDEVQKVNHAYGTNGILTQLEIPLGPAYPWAEAIVAFSDFRSAAHFGQDLAQADGLIKKLISVSAWPLPSYFTAFRDVIPAESHCALVIVAESALEALEALVRQWDGQICYQKSAQDASKGVSLGEYSWNHTTLHARNVDPALTYLQTLFPDLDRVEQMMHQFGDEVMMHLEFLRVGGAVKPVGLQVMRYTTEERLNAIIQAHEAEGALIFNPHTYILEDGGMKAVDLEQLRFKELVDPYGLFNPGKMRAWIERGCSRS